MKSTVELHPQSTFSPSGETSVARADEHEATAERNERFSALVLDQFGDEHADWAVVAIFYSAVRYGRAYLAALSGATITSHTSFETAFLRISKERSLYRYYRELKDEAERARYDCVSIPRADVEDLRDRCFKPWRDWIKKQIPRNPRPKS
jgi:hypothetical protein